jgi:hypothetical protein
MASSSQLFLNTEDSNLNVDTPVLKGYDSNMNVEMLPEEDEALQTPKNVAEDALGVDAYVSKLHLTNLKNNMQLENLIIAIRQDGFFLKVNNNHPIDLSHN